MRQLALSTIDVIVTRNDTLDRIFRRLKLNLADLASLRMLPGIRATLDSLRPGESLHLTHRDGELFGLERRLNESQTLKVSRDAAGSRRTCCRRPCRSRAARCSGVITSSLFEAVEAAGANDQTALALADIFGWDIDFVLDVRPGDTFVVTYEEIWRDGAYLHDGPIEAAEFVNQGRDFPCRALQRPRGRLALLHARRQEHAQGVPARAGRVHPRQLALQFGALSPDSAPHPRPQRRRLRRSYRHTGARRRRWAHPFRRLDGRLRQPVEIEHSSSIVTVYGHLSRFAQGTHLGAHVTQGTVIAYVGMTGLATGPHLHYEYRVNGVFKNPQTVALPGAAPIDARWREDFLARSAAAARNARRAAGADARLALRACALREHAAGRRPLGDSSRYGRAALVSLSVQAA